MMRLTLLPRIHTEDPAGPAMPLQPYTSSDLLYLRKASSDHGLPLRDRPFGYTERSKNVQCRLISKPRRDGTISKLLRLGRKLERRSLCSFLAFSSFFFYRHICKNSVIFLSLVSLALQKVLHNQNELMQIINLKKTKQRFAC